MAWSEGRLQDIYAKGRSPNSDNRRALQNPPLRRLKRYEVSISLLGWSSNGTHKSGGGNGLRPLKADGKGSDGSEKITHRDEGWRVGRGEVSNLPCL